MIKSNHYLIVGGSTGMGFSAASALIKQGAKVMIIGRNAQTVEQAQQSLGANCIGFVGDACLAETTEQAIEHLHQVWGRSDGLYHVAGGSGRSFGDGPLHQMSIEGWNKTFELNLTSMMLSNRAMIRYFLKHGIRGKILNMGSVLGFSPSPEYFTTHAYAATKSAIIGFSKSIAAHYAKEGIQVNVVAPALVETPMAKRAKEDEQIQDFIKTKQPLEGGRMGLASDLDQAVLMFLSSENNFMTGQVLAVDGGWCLSEGQLK
ncbi:SDR family oxidoreductase [Persicobacter psychrovividus]|uniref:Short-chain dehydrogenase n=1 Tax=Persicobacter psychrovividus TaxID=387638 RepID=A0ABM7VJR0_9BACT|nr:short-chain dehydrogenase [Persicobacter psychrovividus]